MTGSENNNDEAANWLMIGLGLCAIAWFIWMKLPQLVLLPVGALVACLATFAPGSEGPAWRAAGIKLIAAGLIVAVAFLLFWGPIGADAQMRRFIRAWNDGSKPAAVLKHPWAVIPPGSAFLLAGAGSILVWRTK